MIRVYHLDILATRASPAEGHLWCAHFIATTMPCQGMHSESLECISGILIERHNFQFNSFHRLSFFVASYCFHNYMQKILLSEINFYIQ